MRWFANPHPLPKASSPALKEEPGEREAAPASAYIGAFGEEENWLDGWTFFGAESEYDPRGRADDQN